MIELEAAWKLIGEVAAPLGVEEVPLERALGRVLRQDVVADLDSPPFDSSAMDGYAVRSPAGAEGFLCIGEVGAGDTRDFDLQPGECSRIFTGGKVPAAAERVVMQERAVREGDWVRVQSHDAPSFIRRTGENCRRGDVVVQKGTVLQSIDLAALAACGVTMPRVTRRPRAYHLVAGDELVAPGQTPTGTQIRDSNSILVRSFLERLDVELVGQIRMGDSTSPEHQVPACDLLLVSGGASVGDRDHAKTILDGLGYKIGFERVNLRPGKPTVFAIRRPATATRTSLIALCDQRRTDAVPSHEKTSNRNEPTDATSMMPVAFALPGNPVSHWVVLELLVRSAIRRLQGLRSDPVRHEGWLEKDFECRPDARQTFWPCRAEVRKGRFFLMPLRFVSSGDVMNTVGANALLPVASQQSSIAADRPVEFILCHHGG